MNRIYFINGKTLDVKGDITTIDSVVNIDDRYLINSNAIMYIDKDPEQFEYNNM